MRLSFLSVLLCLVAVQTGCEESPTGRTQVKLVPASQLAEVGSRTFSEMLRSQPLSDDPAARDAVECVARALVDVLPEAHGSWSIALFDDPTPNAFALPGGKLGVHSGMLRVARGQDQLAAVLGHEMAHVLADHANERLTQQLAVQGGLMLVDLLSAEPESLGHQVLRKALGLGARYGLLLPYSRAHEREADLIGRDLMAEAGFDPRESLALWRNMAEAGGEEPLEFLSTHPSHESRLDELQEGMDPAVALSAQARRAGRRPRCAP